MVGIELNMEKLTLNFWLNGRYLKERMKKLTENEMWIPTIKFKEADYFVILNPFAQGRGILADEINQNHMPKALRCNETQSSLGHVASIVNTYLFVHSVPAPLGENGVLNEADL